jgi:CheY-like chemotaxis protein
MPSPVDSVSSVTVLIADDDAQMRNARKAILTRDGYSTLIACDGQTGIGSITQPPRLHPFAVERCANAAIKRP